MNRFFFNTLLHHFFILLTTISVLSAQSLPDEMRFSPDGRMLLSGGEATTGFYEESALHAIEITFPQANYWNTLTANYNSGTDLLAHMKIDGVDYDSVGVRFKGATSYFRNNTDKKSFNITMDWLRPTQDVMGYETLNLNCGYEDPSFVREVLYNHIGRNYTPGLKSNYATLKINGQNWGPYANVQQLNGEYLREWFMSSDGTRWRALKPGALGGPGGGGPGGGGVFGTGFSTLNYNGPDSTDYDDYYTLKKTSKANPWEDLIRGTDKLNNLPIFMLEDSLHKYIDVDKALWFLAHEIIFTDDDSYVWKGGMDYYVYWEPETDRLVPLEYDGNSCMNLSRTNWDPFYNENDARFPLMNRLFAVPAFRQRYLAHMRTILNEHMVQSEITATINGYVAMIASLVQNDPKAIYTYNEFVDEVEDIKTFINNRRTYLLNHAEVNVTGLDISTVEYATNGVAFEPPISGQTTSISAAISGALGVGEINLYYGTGFVGQFEKTEMFDDGMHDDGAAGDGVYGATIPGFGAGTYVRYYIEAIAGNTLKTATYSPPGAEHDIYVYQVARRASSASSVVINELMASNSTTVMDSAGEFDDWIELYNKSSQDEDISGFFLTDKSDNLTKWTIPVGTIVPANGYLIIWADEDGSQGDLHANFKLSASGETVILLDPDTMVVDEVMFGQQTTDMGYARVPNGTGNFVIQGPTFSNNNVNPTAIGPTFEELPLSIYPNPAQHTLHIALEGINIGKTVEIYNSLAQRVWKGEIRNNIQVNVSNWPTGIYVVRVDRTAKNVLITH